ncbi:MULTISPECIES: Hsp70 family protein [unclassified Gordonia (in: high G+C Gram-positive bacteria)]|uniref:Hsp70 family protein n=1 Tax=Gordonia TaxID=2053 RepID=UPI0010F98300|nr:MULTISPECIES: Hsp70 family protein [unclassified Gordonia (in: high G+C Gram-positive bacteria)]MBN0973297.1 Hsp70 family protein [Gordonia sp. BP-119]MBN0983330.1 Hsp70 family protein [Gordonia sp. BP-94]MBR7194286.1 Hsp70 family protein [Gordonia sp. SCSIO 19800]MDT0221926.1 Hsp70 family protein [Gordonia sp. AC31]
MSKVIGIDLGTTNSAVAVLADDGIPTIIHNREGDNTTPSAVLFDDGDVTVGKQAKNAETSMPGNVVRYVKRHMGSPDYKFIPDGDSTEYGPELISSFILRFLVDDASAYLGEKVDEVVITVPAYFGDAERTATRQAGEIAGLNVLQVINEPTAAALSFGLKGGYNGRVLVYDLGGGTFDVTLMDISHNNFTVLASAGDRNLGGFDFDNELIRLTEAKYRDLGGELDPDDDKQQALIREQAEAAKHRLSTSDKAKIRIGTESITIMREEFDRVVGDLVTRTRYILEDVMDQCGLSYSDVDKLLLVGGSTRMKIVERSVKEWTGLEPDKSVHPDEAVALGAAIVAELRNAVETGEPPAVQASVSDVVAQGLGVAVLADDGSKMLNSLVVVPNTRVPNRVEASSFSTVGATRQINFRITEGDENGAELQYVKVIGESLLALDYDLPAKAPLRVVFVIGENQTVEAELHDAVSGRLIGQMNVQRTANLDAMEVQSLRKQSREIVVQ